jgi:hypothetical protein
MAAYVTATLEAATSAEARADPVPAGIAHAIEADGDVTACGMLVGELHVYRDRPWTAGADACAACERALAGADAQD